MEEKFSRLRDIPEITWLSIFAIIFIVLLLPVSFLVANTVRQNATHTASSDSEQKDKNALTLKHFQPEDQKIKLQQITVSYSNKTLSYKSSKVIEGIVPDFRLASFSPFSLEVMSGSQTLFKTKVHINTHAIMENLEESKVSLSSTTDTVIFLPFIENADSIKVYRFDKEILEIPITKSLQSFKPVQIVSAALPNSKLCGPLTVAVIADGYQEANGEARFKADMNLMISAFQKVEPYQGNIDKLFKFVPVYKKEILSCSGQACIKDAGAERVKAYMPGAARYIVLSDNFNSGGYFGITSDIGGDIAVMSSKNSREGEGSFTYTASHEFLGHSVGFLHDRYLYSEEKQALYFDEVKSGLVPRSNCTDNPNGESSWGGKGYPSCEASNLYAPAPIECDGRGHHETMMSSSDCAASAKFDKVEQSYIKNTILSKINSCNSGSDQVKKCEDFKNPVECNKVDGCLYQAHVGCRNGNRSTSQMCNDDGTKITVDGNSDPNSFCPADVICDRIPAARVASLEKEMNVEGKIFPALCVKPHSILDKGPCNSDAVCSANSYCSNNVCCPKDKKWDSEKKDCVSKAANTAPVCLACGNIIYAWRACEGNSIYTYKVQGEFDKGVCVYPQATKSEKTDCASGTVCVNKIGNTNLDNAPECVKADVVKSCGGDGESCCEEKSSCKNGLECNGGVCTQVCGGMGQACCKRSTGEQVCDFEDATCQNGICRAFCALGSPENASAENSNNNNVGWINSTRDVIKTSTWFKDHEYSDCPTQNAGKFWPEHRTDCLIDDSATGPQGGAQGIYYKHFIPADGMTYAWNHKLKMAAVLQKVLDVSRITDVTEEAVIKNATKVTTAVVSAFPDDYATLSVDSLYIGLEGGNTGTKVKSVALMVHPEWEKPIVNKIGIDRRVQNLYKPFIEGAIGKSVNLDDVKYLYEKALNSCGSGNTDQSGLGAQKTFGDFTGKVERWGANIENSHRDCNLYVFKT